MKLLIIDSDCAGLSLAYRAAQAGHAVRLFLEPMASNNQETGAGFKGIERIENWVASVRWADLILATSNRRYVDRLDRFRRAGFPVFGPSIASANLEIKRGLGMKTLEEHGIKSAGYRTFPTVAAAMKDVEKTGKRYVFKTLGDNEDKSLTYVSKHAADLLTWLEWQLGNGTKIKGEVMLQDFIDGIEIGVSRFVGTKGFVGPWNESFEYPKLLSGDYGPNVGEMGTIAYFTNESKLGEETLAKLEKHLVSLNHTGDIALGFIVERETGKPYPTEWTCYDKETEVLTNAGWKHIKNCSVGELVATLDPATNLMEYRPVHDVIVKNFCGDLVHFSGDRSAVDLMVTPDHAMWCMDGKHEGSWEFRAAEQVAKAGNWKIQRSAGWEGEERDMFTIPAYTESHKLNWPTRPCDEHLIEHPAIDIPMDCWLKFLGLYISEGSMGNRCERGIPYIVNIAQQGKRKTEVRAALADMPFQVSEYARCFQIASRQLAMYMHSLGLGLSHEKHIPREFMNLSSRQLRILLDHLIMGDGSVHKRNGQRMYGTTSQVLSGQVQELILKTGGMARVRKTESKGTKMRVGEGKEYTRNHDIYVVVERKTLVDGWIDKRMVKRVPHDGDVYCLNVPPHHLLYVRRNGNAAWCGNCRFGWPIENLMLAATEGDPIAWMKDALEGKDTTTFRKDIGCCLVLAHGAFPDNAEDLKCHTGRPIYGITRGNKKYLHPQAVKIDVLHDMTGDKVIRRPVWNTTGGYAAVVTGFGRSVRQSADRAYKTMGQLHVAGAKVRDDVGESLEEKLPILHRFGYATHCNYE